MQIIENFEDYHKKTPLVLTLGVFDGVHLGHISIINQLKKIAKEKKIKSALLTFWPHPRKMMFPNQDLKLLNTLEEKLFLLKKSGIDFVFLKNFDEELRNLSGEDFVKEILVKKLNVKHLIIGYDHTFGKNKSGDFSLLKKLSKELNFEVEQLEAVKSHESSISSTKIRNYLAQGNIKNANKMLGYYYSISGEIIKGNQLGRTIGFPTANILINEYQLLPKNASYIVRVFVDEKIYKGMLNIGFRPTIDGKKLQTEVFILDFNKDIYRKIIKIEFIDFLRDEVKFNGIEELKNQLKSDQEYCRNYKLDYTNL